MRGNRHSHLTLRLALLLSAALLVPACGGGGGGGPADTTAPTVTGTTPGSGATGVLVGDPITATFDEAMNAATIDGSSFFLTASPPLAGTVTYDAPTMTATFTPSAALAYSTTYTAFLTTAITDTAGNSLAALFTWSFTTEADPDSTAPQVAGATPTDGATDVSHQLAGVTVTFDEAMDPATITSGSVVLVDGAAVAGTVTYDGPSMTATFTPAGNLDFITEYTIVVTTAVTDLAGNPLAATFTSKFTTEADTFPPTVTAVTPLDGATNVPRVGTVATVTFSEDMDPAYMTSTYVRINGVGGTTTYDAPSRTATFTPAGPMPWNTLMTGFVSSLVRDTVGNQLGANYTWTFTTEPDLVPPTVTAVTPLDGAMGVDPASVLTATFDEPMNGATLNASTFTVDNGVTGTVTYSAGTMTATFTPDTWMPASTLFTATITTGAQDAQGNPLAAPFVWTFTTAADNTPPTVTATHPIDGARIISRDSVVQAIFSEPMDGATITNATFTVSGTTGTVTYDAPSWTATYTPSPRFPAGVTRTATLSTAIQDVEGNGLASAVNFTFRVVTTPIRVNAQTPASHEGLDVAFNAAGDGVAVWRVSSGGGSVVGARILASVYTAATSTWSAESVLAAYPTGTVSEPVVASNGTTFLAAWGKTDGADQTLAAIYSGGSWGAPEVLQAAFNNPTNAVSNGSGYAVHSNRDFWVRDGGTWTETILSTGSSVALAGSSNGYAMVYVTISGKDDFLRSRIWSGGAWGAETTIYSATLGGVSNGIVGLSLVSDGTGYALCYRHFWSSIGASGDSVGGAVYSGGSWTQTGFDGGSILGSPMIASGGAGYAVTWNDNNPLGNRAMLARVYTAGAWSSTTFLEGPTLGGYTPKAVSANGSGFAATWTGPNGFVTKVYASGSWGVQTVLAASGASTVVMEGNGTRHAAIWTRSSDDAIIAAVHSGVSWSASTLQAAGSGPTLEMLLADNGASDVHAFWIQGTAVNTRRTSSGAWQAAVNLVQGTYRGHAADPRFAANAAGDGMAVWKQFDAGLETIWARPFQGGAWGTAFRVTTDGEFPKVAVNGTHAVVVWRKGSTNTEVDSRRYAFGTSTWDALVPIKTGGGTVWPPSVASDGSGFMVIYTTSSTLLHRTSADGFTWNAEVSTSGGGGVDPELYSNGTTYLMVLRSASFPGTALRGRIFSAGAWGSNTTLGSLNSSNSKRVVAPHLGGYMVAWEANGNDVDARVHDGAAWGVVTQLNVSGTGGDPAVASNGTDAVCYFRDGSSLFVARTFTGGVWDPAVPVPVGADGGLAATATDFAAVNLRNDGVEVSVSSNSFANGSWGHAGGFIEGQAGAADEASIVTTGVSYLGIWERINPTIQAGQIWSVIGN